jgi:hypothetical protein
MFGSAVVDDVTASSVLLTAWYVVTTPVQLIVRSSMNAHSHEWPVKPSGHVHVYPSTPSTHVPPFSHL